MRQVSAQVVVDTVTFWAGEVHYNPECARCPLRNDSHGADNYSLTLIRGIGPNISPSLTWYWRYSVMSCCCPWAEGRFPGADLQAADGLRPILNLY